jgi:exodeoxyribonuclease V alpha subunit
MVLQDALNKSEVSIRYGGTVFKLGDKVMQIKKQL